MDIWLIIGLVILSLLAGILLGLLVILIINMIENNSLKNKINKEYNKDDKLKKRIEEEKKTIDSLYNGRTKERTEKSRAAGNGEQAVSKPLNKGAAESGTEGRRGIQTSNVSDLGKDSNPVELHKPAAI